MLIQDLLVYRNNYDYQIITLECNKNIINSKRLVYAVNTKGEIMCPWKQTAPLVWSHLP